MTKKKIKKKIPIKLIIFILILIGAFFGIRYYLYRQTNEFKLKEIGYSMDQINIIEKQLSDKEIETIMNKDLISDLTSIIEQKYFIFDNLDRYLAFHKEESKRSIKDVISMVNTNVDEAFYTNIKDADTSQGLLTLVNKYYKLLESYKPDDIVPISIQYAYANHSIKQEVYDHYKEMWNAAKSEELTLIVTSSYRDFAFQTSLYNSYKDNNGEEWADSVSARPGHSEHQLGLALDIVTYNSTMDNFDKTEEFKWLVKNSYKYGFILRYPKDKEYITGYSYEPWHYRYVGKDTAKKVYDSGLTYDEYYAYYVK